MKTAERLQATRRPERHVTRRRFLIAVLSGLVLSVPLYARPARAGSILFPRKLPPWFDLLVPQRQPAARLGRAYLESRPELAQRKTLLARLKEAAARQSDTASVPGDPEKMATRLRQAVREDYVRGDVVNVAGWILSVTEARLYALAYLG